MIKLRFKDLGERRWLCYASGNHSEMRAVSQWAKETFGDRTLLTTIEESRMANDGRRLYEMQIRGGDINDRVMFALRWGNGNAGT